MRQRYNKTQRFYALAPVGITVFLQLWLVDIQSKLLLTLPTIEGRSVVSKAVQVILTHVKIIAIDLTFCYFTSLLMEEFLNFAF